MIVLNVNLVTLAALSLRKQNGVMHMGIIRSFCLSFMPTVFCRAENMSRKAAGEEPLAEEDPSNPIFKPIPEPSRLDSFLITNQIANYCNQINGYVNFNLVQNFEMSCLEVGTIA